MTSNRYRKEAHAKKVAALCFLGAFPVVAQEYKSRSSESFFLWLAAEEGNSKQVQNYLNKGIPINGKDRWGKTALHRASYKGHKEVVEILLKKGADREVKDKRGSTPLYQAIRKRHPGLAKLLLQHKANAQSLNCGGDTSLHKAVSKGLMEVIELLRSYKANVSAKNKYGNTPLHKAARKGHADIAEVLIIQHDADPMVQNKQGYTPLHRAAILKKPLACYALLKGVIFKTILEHYCEAKPRIDMALVYLSQTPLAKVKDVLSLIFGRDASLLLDVLCYAIVQSTKADRFSCIDECLHKRDCKILTYLKLHISKDVAARFIMQLAQERLVRLCKIPDKKNKLACELSYKEEIANLLNPKILQANLCSLIRAWID